MGLLGCSGPPLPPVDPVTSESGFRSRTLDDAGLVAWFEGRGRTIPVEWSLADLTVAALYYNPELAIARARVVGRLAAEETAEAIPNPTLVLPFERSLSSNPSPWLYGFTVEMPVDFVWKRGYQIDLAQRWTEAARLEVGEAAWQVRHRVRSAWVDLALSGRELELRTQEVALRKDLVGAMERRVTAGESFRLDADQARAELSRARVLVLAAAGRLPESRSVLATSMGLPARAVERLTGPWPEVERLPREEELRVEEWENPGLLHRLDIRRALVEVAQAEAALGLELRKRWPDLSVGPGLLWDHGERKFTLGLSVTLPVLNQNGGPIAEAAAHRTEAASRLLSLQAQAIGERDQALARYRSARSEWEETERTQSAIAERERATRRALELGEMDQIALLGIRLESLSNGAVRLQALRRAQEALGALEDAVQHPLDGVDFGNVGGLDR
jgi:outer membrane protein TolC